MRNERKQYITRKLVYQQLRRKLVYAKQTIWQYYTETKQFEGEREANRIKYQLFGILDIRRLRQEAVNARRNIKC